MRSRLSLSFVAIVLCTSYFYIVLPLCLANRPACTGNPVAPPTSPTLYRVLPGAVEKLIAPTVSPYSPNILWVDMLLQFGMATATVGGLYLWLKRWANPDQALIGVLVFSMVYLAAYHYWFRSIGTSAEILFVICALIWVKRPLPLVILSILGAFNRETSLVIPAIYIFYHMDQWRMRRYQIVSVGLVGLWVVITAGLHIVLGPAPHMVGGLEGTWAYNLSNLPDAIVASFVFVPVAIGIGLGYRNAPPILKRLVWVALVYFAAILVGAAWNESERLILPVLPLILPLLFTVESGQFSAKMIQ